MKAALRLLILFVMSVVLFSAFESRVSHSSYKLVKVGGTANQCECTYRIER
jgi:hypothetical protein